MGIFSSSLKRNPYVPPSDTAASSTLLTGGDPNLIRVSGGSDPAASTDNVQVAQQRPSPAVPQSTPAQLMTRPGRGYGVLSMSDIERGMKEPLQRSINRNQALIEIASHPPSPGAIREPLPEDWRQTKPPEYVHALDRAAQRHDVPIDMLARQMYQEGKFGERRDLRTDWDHIRKTLPVGLAQMTTETFDELAQRAKLRGDIERVKELRGFSPTNPDHAFDAAAEHMAYLYRRLGSWPAAVAAYNYTPDYFEKWLKGSIGVKDPSAMKDASGYDKWKEITNYVSNAFQNIGPNPQTGDIYARRSSASRFERGFKVADSIKLPAFHDEKENP
jgi:hypothetical protein